VDRLAEAMGDDLASPSVAEAGRERLEMGERGPEELLREGRPALLSLVGEVVAVRRGRATDRRKRSAVKPQRIAHIVSGVRKVPMVTAQNPAFLAMSLFEHPFAHQQNGLCPLHFGC